MSNRRSRVSPLGALDDPQIAYGRVAESFERFVARGSDALGQPFAPGSTWSRADVPRASHRRARVDTQTDLGNLVSCLRRHAMDRPGDAAFVGMTNDPSQQTTMTYGGARPPRPRDCRLAPGHGSRGRTRRACVPARPRIHCGILRRALRRVCRRPDVPAAPPNARPVPRTHCRRRRTARARHRRRDRPIQGDGRPVRSDPLARHRRARRRSRSRLDRTRPPPAFARDDPVHVGLDQPAQGRHAEPRQPRRQHACDQPRFRRRKQHRRRVLAPGLPRHGPHRRRSRARLLAASPISSWPPRRSSRARFSGSTPSANPARRSPAAPTSPTTSASARSAPDQRAALDLSSWSLAFIGAEAVQPATLARFTEAFAPCGFDPAAFYPCYGLAEATLMVTGPKHGAGAAVRAFRDDALAQNRVVPLADDAPHARRLVGCGAPVDSLSVAIVDAKHPRVRRSRPRRRDLGRRRIRGPGLLGRPATDRGEVPRAAQRHRRRPLPSHR